VELYLTPPYVVMAWYLVKQQDNLTFIVPVWRGNGKKRMSCPPPTVLISEG